ncbi:hypothetical protein ADUPG1_005085, partial [Aduncisulcus paluster]
THEQVQFKGAMKKNWRLRNYTDKFPNFLDIEVSHVVPIQHDQAFAGIGKACQQFEQGGFTAAHGADDSDFFSRLCFKGYIFESVG